MQSNFPMFNTEVQSKPKKGMHKSVHLEEVSLGEIQRANRLTSYIKKNEGSSLSPSDVYGILNKLN